MNLSGEEKMISKEEYQNAIEQKTAAENVIGDYHRQELAAFKERWKEFEHQNKFFVDDELIYSAGARCKCGAGLAYPKKCGPSHQWTCADLLTGRFDRGQKHDAFPFAFYDIKSEQQPSAGGATTRPKV